MPTALVTGVAGFIGSNLADTLLDRGYDVRGVDNFETGRPQNLETLQTSENFEFREADIRDADTMAAVTDGVDYVFHQAALPPAQRSDKDPVTITDVNCTGTATVLTTAREAGVDTVVVASCVSVYGSKNYGEKSVRFEPQPESPYAHSKLVTERLALQFSDLYEIDTVALRYFNIFGPNQDPASGFATIVPKLIIQGLRGEQPVIDTGRNLEWDFLFVENAVQANILAAESDVTGEVFNVGRGNAYPIRAIVENIEDELGIRFDPRYTGPQPGDEHLSKASIREIQSHLNYEPPIGLTCGLKRTVEHYVNNRPHEYEPR